MMRASRAYIRHMDIRNAYALSPLSASPDRGSVLAWNHRAGGEEVPFQPEPFVQVLLVAIGAGLLGSLLGLGGGIIVIPVLTTMFGYDIRPVIGASLISVIATSSGAAAAYVKNRMANLRVAVFLELATVTGAIGGALLSAKLSPHALQTLFGVLLLYSAYAMFRRRSLHESGAAVPYSAMAERLRLQGSYHDEATGETVRYRAGRLGPGFVVMWWAGALSGVLGIGSGVFKVIGMDLVMGLPIKISSATSNFMMGVTAAAGAGIHLANGDIDPVLAAPVALGVVLGAWSGSKLLPKMRGATIRTMFVPVLVFMGLQMLWKGVQP